jgi:predicted peptidase
MKPLRTFFRSIVALLLAVSLRAQGDAPVVQTLPADLQRNVRFLNPEYLLYSPAEPAGTQLPLLIFLHGAGGVGTDIQRIKDRPSEVWRGIAKLGKGPCLLVAPQCLASAGSERGIWTAEDLNVLLAHLQATLPVDHRRIYLSGISMGGYGTWAWAAQNPHHFAAIAPIVGGIGREGPKAVTPDFDRWAAKLATIPVHAFVGALDTTVPPERSERMIAAIRRAGGKEARLKVYPDQAHGAARVVVTDPEYYDWIFAQRRDSNPHATAPR